MTESNTLPPGYELLEGWRIKFTCQSCQKQSIGVTNRYHIQELKERTPSYPFICYDCHEKGVPVRPRKKQQTHDTSLTTDNFLDALPTMHGFTIANGDYTLNKGS